MPQFYEEMGLFIEDQRRHNEEQEKKRMYDAAGLNGKILGALFILFNFTSVCLCGSFTILIICSFMYRRKKNSWYVVHFT